MKIIRPADPAPKGKERDRIRDSETLRNIESKSEWLRERARENVERSLMSKYRDKEIF